MEITKSEPGHTPFCNVTCSIKHCELIMCLVNCPDNKRMIKGLASLKQSLFQALQEGWNPHANVVDPLIEFQTPLIHWATILGKDFALEWLIKMNFRTNAVCDRTGESAVHRMLKCLYAVKQLDGMSAREIFNLFSHLLSLLVGSCADLLTIQDSGGNTAFHTCAMLIINQEGTTSELEYFENCMVTMLRSLTNEKGSANSDSSAVLNYKNTNSETMLHILARKKASFNIMRYVIRRFNHIIDKNCLNKEGKSAFDIAINNQTFSVAKELDSTNNQDTDASATSFSVDAHIEEWDPEFGKPSKIQTSKPRQRKRSHARAGVKFSQNRAEKNVCEEPNELETAEVGSSASSTSSTCAYNATSVVGDEQKQSSLSPEVIFHQRSDSPPFMQSASSTTDKNMDDNISGMISVNLTNVVAIDTEDLSVNRVSCATRNARGEEIEVDQHSLSFISHQVENLRQKTETRRKSSTGPGERTDHIGITASSLRSSTGVQKVIVETPYNRINDTIQSGSTLNCKSISCSPLMKLIKEESDVATLLESRLKDKRQKLQTYLQDYTRQMREMEKRGSQCCLLLSDYKDEKDKILIDEQVKEQEKRKLMHKIQDLENSRIEPRKRLKFLEAKILELERLSEQSLKTIEIRNEHCTEVKRKLTEYDNALSEIATQNESLPSTKKIKIEPLDK